MESLVTAVSYERIVQYMAIAASTVFFYDFALTLPSEVSRLNLCHVTLNYHDQIEFMWTPWGGWVGRLVFFYVRAMVIVNTRSSGTSDSIFARGWLTYLAR